jgi:hypothetical protein
VFVHLQLASPSPVTPSVSHCSKLFVSPGSSEPSAHAYPLSFQSLARIFRRFELNPFFSHYSELFRPSQKPISFLFKQIQTLCAKHPGWHTPRSADLPIGPPAQSLPLASRFDTQFLILSRPRPVPAVNPFVSYSSQTPCFKAFPFTFFQKTPGGWGPTPCESRLPN